MNIYKYEALLIDAYGVLVHSAGLLPGAQVFIDSLHKSKVPYRILTNSSRNQRELGDKYRTILGLDISDERIISSGSLLDSYFKDFTESTKVLYFGSATMWAELESREKVQVINMDRALEAETVIIGHLRDVSYLETLNALINVAYQRIARGLPFKIIIINPDCVYPVNENEFNLGPGAAGASLEAALAARFGNAGEYVQYWGKPFQPIFDHAKKSLGIFSGLAMIGDQMATDVKGAKSNGIDAILVTSGVADVHHLTSFEHQPDFVVNGVLELLDEV